MSALLSVLDRLKLAISGDWFVGDGALLGIHREGKLIEYDNDIDIYLYPETKIDLDILRENKLKIEKYYLNDKVYDPTFNYTKKNAWKEYMSCMKLANPGCGRREIIMLSAMSYDVNRIQNKHTDHNIDIFYLIDRGDKYTIDNWDNIFFYKTELNELEYFTLQGVEVIVPKLKERMSILQRQYGKDYMTPNKDFKYF